MRPDLLSTVERLIASAGPVVEAANATLESARVVRYTERAERVSVRTCLCDPENRYPDDELTAKILDDEIYNVRLAIHHLLGRTKELQEVISNSSHLRGRILDLRAEYERLDAAF